MRGIALEESSVDASKDKVKVLYIAGWGRSGSTILGRILGQIRDFFLVGELRYIWDRGWIENRLCSCGAPFRKCLVWQEVADQVLDDSNVSAEELVDLRDRGLRTRHILLTPTHRSLQKRVSQMGNYPETLERLYRAVREVSRSRVIVDTSKFPSYGYILGALPGIELYVLHLVRDPRATAYSWGTKRKLSLDREDKPNRSMTPHGSVESSLVWNEWNLAIENSWRRRPERYMRLRYEDFVENPRSSVKRILQFLGEETAELPFEDEQKVTLAVPHAFSGNPDRFLSGTVTVKPDEGWKRDMSIAQQLIVSSVTWPGMIRYNYPLRPQRGSSLQRLIATRMGQR